MLASFCVILIHAPLPGVLGNVLEAVSRVAVPLFFMISGYYAIGKSKAQILKSAKKTGVMLLWSAGLYFLWEIVWSFYYGTTIDRLTQYFSLRTLAETILLNTGPLLGHLWFLLALLYCYLGYVLFLQKTSLGVRTAIAFVLLVGFFSVRALLKMNQVSDSMYYLRNFLFIGVPFFLMGGILRQGQKWIESCPVTLWIGMASAGVVAAVVERFAIGSSDLYFGTVAASAALLSLAQKTEMPVSDKLAELGWKHAGNVYVFHVIVISAVNMVAAFFCIFNTAVFRVLRPVIVLAISIVVSYMKNTVLRKSKKH